MSVLNVDAAKPYGAWTETTRSGFHFDDGAQSVRHSFAPSVDTNMNYLLEKCIQEDLELQNSEKPSPAGFSIPPLVQTVSVDQGQTETASVAADSWRPVLKTEDNPSREINEKMRRTICRKIFQEIIKKFDVQKLQAQELALELENKVNQMSPFGSQRPAYETNIRQLFSKLRVVTVFTQQSSGNSLKTLDQLVARMNEQQ